MRLSLLQSLLFAFTLITFSACKEEGCTDNQASNYNENADEEDGSCEYDRDAFIGAYNAAIVQDCEKTQDYEFSGMIELTYGTDIRDRSKVIIVLGFTNISATANGNTLVIPSQKINSYVYSGSATINGIALKVDLTEYDEVFDENCQFTIEASKL